jgi:nitrogen fixation protein FixH
MIQARRPRQLTGIKVFLAFAAFFVVVASVNAVMLRAATSTFGGVEVDSAYRMGLSFNKETAAAARQDLRHWNVDATLVRHAGDATQIGVRIRDAAGAPPAEIALAARLIHPADARRDHRVVLHQIAGGEFKGETDATPGRWDLLIEASRAGEILFRSRSRLTLK